MVEHVVCNDEIRVRFPMGPYFEEIWSLRKFEKFSVGPFIENKLMLRRNKMTKISYLGIKELLDNGEYETHYACAGPIPPNVQPKIDALLNLELKHLQRINVKPKTIEVKVTIDIDL